MCLPGELDYCTPACLAVYSQFSPGGRRPFPHPSQSVSPILFLLSKVETPGGWASVYLAGYDPKAPTGGPPMIVSDAKALALDADGTILVLNAALTRRGIAQRSIRELRQAGTIVLGVVLVGVRVMKGGYFREMIESYQEYQKALPVHSV